MGGATDNRSLRIFFTFSCAINKEDMNCVLGDENLSVRKATLEQKQKMNTVALAVLKQNPCVSSVFVILFFFLAEFAHVPFFPPRYIHNLNSINHSGRMKWI